jgi:protein CrcB
MAGVMAAAVSTRRRCAAVLIGGFCGASTRYLLSSGMQAWLGKGWPYDILLINITGALLLALVTTLADDTVLIGPTRRLFINVGFLGAYTTFSSLVLGDMLLLGQGQWLPALLYLMGSFVGGVLAVWLGDWLGQWYLRVRRRAVMQTKATRKRTGALGALSSDGSASEDHVDVQDDLLLPGRVDERETGPRRS